MGEKYPALRYSRNMWKECKIGIWTIECDSWKEFEDRMEKYKECSYVWRGQSCEKPLLPSIYRDHRITDDKSISQHLNQFKKDMPKADALEEFLEQAKKNRTDVFEKALLEYCRMIKPKADDTDPRDNYVKEFFNDIYWSIGQHHGLKTPLLDWTMDPFKALFFAFCERKESNDRRIVFGLAEKSRLLLENIHPKKRYIEFLTNLNFIHGILCSSDSPHVLKERIGRMFDRINAQDGMFTKSLQIECVSRHAQRCYNYYKKHRNDEIVFLVRIIIPNRVRESFLKKLEEKKITYRTMFPDLEGTAWYCNLKFESVGV